MHIPSILKKCWPKNRGRKLRRTSLARPEILEDRVLLSGVSWQQSGTEVTIEGSPLADELEVRESSSGSLEIVADGLSTDTGVAVSGISHVTINGNAGNDIVALGEALSFGLTVNSGDGDDFVSASGVLTSVTIHGNGGNDTLIGGDGDDSLFGNDGDDVLVGGPGIDSLDGGSGTNTLISDSFDGFTVSQSAVTVQEGGAAATFEVVLTRAPSSDVTIDVSNPDSSQVVLSSTSLTFTGSNWDVPQAVTVSAVADNVVDPDHSLTLDLSVASGSAFEYLLFQRAVDVQVNNVDVNSASLAFDFSSSVYGGSPAASGYTGIWAGLPGTGSLGPYDGALGYGWVSNIANIFGGDDITYGDDLTRDFNYAYSPSEFVVNVPNGFYEARVIMGAAHPLVSSHNLFIEGVLEGNYTTGNGAAAHDVILPVTVIDNQFTLRLESTGGQSRINALVLTPYRIVVEETGGDTTVNEGFSDTLNVTLSTPPITDVVVTVASDDETQLTASPATLTFNAGNWNTPQQVTVEGVVDNVSDGDHAVSVTFAIDDSLSDPSFHTADDELITGMVFDAVGHVVWGQAGTVITLTGTSEADVIHLRESSGGTLEYEADGVVTDTGVSVSSLTHVTVQANAGNDLVSVDPGLVIPVSLFGGAGDDTLTGGSQGDILEGGGGVDVLVGAGGDDALTIDEFDVPVDGGAGADTLYLGFAGPARVNLSGLNVELIWGTPADDFVSASGVLTSVTIHGNGGNDTLIGGDGDDSLFGNDGDDVLVGGPGIDSLDGGSGTNTLISDSFDGFTVSQSAVTVQEGGAAATFEVVLTRAPSSDVTIDVSNPDSSQVVLSSTSLTFTGSNWDVPQAVTVSAVADNVVDPDHSLTLDLSVASGSAFEYLLFQRAVDVQVNNVDVNSASLAFDFSSSVYGGSPAASGYTGIWAGLPGTGSLGPYDGALGYGWVSNIANIFGGDDITYGDDLTRDFNYAYSPSEFVVNVPNGFYEARVIMGAAHPLVSSHNLFIEGVLEGNYTTGNGAAAHDVILPVTVIDNQFTLRLESTGGQSRINALVLTPYRIVVEETGGDTTVNEGFSDTLNVTLSTPPITDVVVTVASDDETQLTASPATLTFNAGNWNTPQQVTVEGVVDNVSDGDHAVSVTFAIDDSLSDPSFHTADDELITGMVFDAVGHVVWGQAGTVITLTGTSEADVIHLRESSGGTLEYEADGVVTDTGVSVSSLTHVTVQANAGNDLVSVDPGLVIPVSLFGGAGDDSLSGGSAADVIDGGTGDDSLFGNGGADLILIDELDSIISGGAGADTVDAMSAGPISLSLQGLGVETVIGSAGSDYISALGVLSPVVIHGGLGDDTIIGGSGADILHGDGGDDTVFFDSSDVVDGGGGNNLLYNIDTMVEVDVLDGLHLIEGGASDHFRVRLTRPPSEQVHVEWSLSSSVESSTSAVAFDSSNWDMWQDVYLTAIDDSVSGNTGVSFIDFFIGAGSDTSFIGDELAVIAVSVTDNDSSEIAIDDLDNGFATSGAWTDFSAGWSGTLKYAAAGTGDSVARWTFPVSPGQYRVSATWVPFINRATNAPFTVFSGTTELSTVTVDQQLAPAGGQVSGANWEELGIFEVSAGELVVELSNNANGFVIADGILIEAIDSLTSIGVFESAGATDVVEGENADEIWVALGAPPSAGVTVDLSSAQPHLVFPSESSLVFSPQNYFVPQRVYIDSVDDTAIYTEKQSQITLAVNQSLSAGNYHEAGDVVLTVNRTDNDHPVVTGDFNGDGAGDAAVYDSLSGSWKLTTQSGAETESHTWTPTVPASLNSAAGDFNGDGFADIVSGLEHPTLWTGGWSDGAAFRDVAFDVSEFHRDAPVLSAAANGLDLSWTAVEGAESYLLQVEDLITGSVTLVDTNGALTHTLSTTPTDVTLVSVVGVSAEPSRQFSVSRFITIRGSAAAVEDAEVVTAVDDFNGDGRDDIAFLDPIARTISVAVSTGAGFLISDWGRLSSATVEHVQSADFNNDGRSDLAWLDAAGLLHTQLSTATGFVAPHAPVLATISPAVVSLSGDTNGDGLSDLLIQSEATSFTLLESTPTGFQSATYSLPAAYWIQDVVDVSQDGRSDLILRDVNHNYTIGLVAQAGVSVVEWSLTDGTPWLFAHSVEGTSHTLVDAQWRLANAAERFEKARESLLFLPGAGHLRSESDTGAASAGSAFDQAAYLAEQLNGVVDTRLMKGRIRVSAGQHAALQGWLRIPGYTSPEILLSQAGLNPVLDGTTGDLEFDHAWIQVRLPIENEMVWVDWDPSLKSHIGSFEYSHVSPEVLALSPSEDLFASSSFTSTESFSGDNYTRVPSTLSVVSGTAQQLNGRLYFHETGAVVYNESKGLDGSISGWVDKAQPGTQIFGRATENGEVGLRFQYGGTHSVRRTVRYSPKYVDALNSLGTANQSQDVSPGYHDDWFDQPYLVAELYRRDGDDYTVLATTEIAGGYQEQTEYDYVSVPYSYGIFLDGVLQSIEERSASVQVRYPTWIESFDPYNFTLTINEKSVSATIGTYSLTAEIDSHIQPGSWGLGTPTLGQFDNLTFDLEMPLQVGPSEELLKTYYQTPDAISLTPDVVSPRLSDLSYATVSSHVVGQEWTAAEQFRTQVSISQEAATVYSGLWASSDLSGMPLFVSTKADSSELTVFLGEQEVLHQTLTSTSNLEILVEHFSPGQSTPSRAESYKVKDDGYAAVTINVGQFTPDEVELHRQHSAKLLNTVSEADSDGRKLAASRSLLELLNADFVSQATHETRLVNSATSAFALPIGPTSGFAASSRSYSYLDNGAYYAMPEGIVLDQPSLGFVSVPFDLSEATSLGDYRDFVTAAVISDLESSVVSNVTGSDSTSATNALRYAVAYGQQVRRINKLSSGHFEDTFTGETFATLSQKLTHPQFVLDRLISHLDDGGVVTISDSQVNVGDWFGSPYLLEAAAGEIPAFFSFLVSDSGEVLHGAEGDESDTDLDESETESFLANPFAGNLTVNDADVSLRSVFPEAEIRRNWNSALDVDLGFGVGWGFTFGEKLSWTAYEATYIDADGFEHVFPHVTGLHTYTESPQSMPGASLQFDIASNRYELTEKDGTVRRFLPHGYDAYLSEIEDRHGNRLVVNRGADPTKIESVSEQLAGLAERTLFTFAYDGSNISTVEDLSGRVWKYAYARYGAESVLRTVHAPDGSGSTAAQTAVVLSAVDSVFTENGTAEVDPGRLRSRESGDYSELVTYLKFDATQIPATAGSISLLASTAEADDRGTMTVSLGSHSDWTSGSIASSAPTETVQLGQRSGKWENLTWFEVPISAEILESQGDFLTLIIQTDIQSLYGIGLLQGNVQLQAFTQQPQFEYQYHRFGDFPSLTSKSTLGQGTTTFGYFNNGRVARVETPNGNRTTYNYDSAANETRVTTVQGGTERLRFTERGQLSRQIGSDGTILEQQWHPELSLVTRTEGPGGAVTTFQYDDQGLGNLTELAEPSGLVTRYTYEAQFNQLETVESDPDVNFAGDERLVTQNIFDSAIAQGNPIATLDADGQRTEFTYTPQGLIASVTEPRGFESGNTPAHFTTHFQYDVTGQIMQTTLPGPNSGAVVSTVTFDSLGRRLAETDETGVTRQFTYDALDRVLTETLADPYAGTSEALGILTRSSTYNSINQRTSSTDFDGSQALYIYDSAGRRTATIYDDGTAMAVSFDDAGRRSVSTDRRGNTTRTLYDIRGRKSSTILPDGAATSYRYNGGGQSHSMTDPRGSTSVNSYDAAGRLISVTDPLGGMNVMQYDAFGNVIVETDERGVSTSYAFDSLDRPVSVATGDLLVEQLSYDPIGNVVESRSYDISGLTAAEVPADLSQLPDSRKRTVQSVFNERGWVTTSSDELGILEQVTYDDAGRRLAVTDAGGFVTDFVYDDIGRLKTTILPSPDGGPIRPTVTTILDAVGRVTAETDANGNQARYEYNVSDTFRFTIDSLLNRSSQLNNASGDEVLAIDSLGRATNTVRDSRGRVSKMVYPALMDGATFAVPQTLSEFDLAGNRIRSTDALRRSTEYVFDALNRQVQMTLPDPDGSGPALPAVESVEFDAAGHIIGITDALGRQTQFSVDAIGRQTSVSLPDPNGGPAPVVQFFEYDAFGNLTVSQDGLGRRTEYTYDARDRLVQSTLPDPDGAGPLSSPVESRTFDSRGNIRFFTDTLGRVTENEYDNLNRLIRTVAPDPDGVGPLASPQSFSEYDLYGNLTASVDPEGRRTEYVYDSQHRLIETKLPSVVYQGVVTDASEFAVYDAAGNLIEVTDAAGRATQFVYDELDRQVQIVSPDPDGPGPLAAPVHSSFYDLVGNVVRSVDPLGRTTIRGYDDVNRLTQVILPDPDGDGPAESPVSSIHYDVGGNLTHTVDALGRVTQFTYDDWDRQIEVFLPSVQFNNALTAVVSRTEYDLVSNVTSTTDPHGNQTSFVYDGLNRLTATVLPDPDGEGPLTTSQLTLEYDAVGNLTQQTDALGRVTLNEYDDLNRLVRTTLPDPDDGGPQSAPVEMISYDQVGNVVDWVDALGRSTTSEYDAWNRLTKVILPDPDDGGPMPAPESLTEYDLAGNIIATQDPLGRITTFTFDQLDRLVSTQTEDPDGAGPLLPQISTQAYDAIGNVLSINNQGRVTDFGYDELNRLTTVALPDPDGAGPSARPITTTEYDAVGNTTATVDALGRTTIFVLDSLNRVTETQYPHPQDLQLDGPVELTEYDLNGNVISVSDTLGRVTAFEYDGRNRLTLTTLPDPDGYNVGLTARYVANTYDESGNLISVTDQSGRVTQTVFDNLDRPVQTIYPDPDLSDGLPAPAVSAVYDAVGNVISGTDALGRLTTYQYDGLDRLVRTNLPDPDPTDGVPAPQTFTKYDLNGNVISQTDVRGFETTFQFDALNRQVVTVLPAVGGVSPVSSTAYDQFGNVASVTDAELRTTDFHYDALDRLTTTILPAVVVDGVLTRPTIENRYDLLGNQIRQIDEAGLIQETQYDHWSRPVVTRLLEQSGGSEFLLQTTSTEYDAAGNVISEVDPLGRITRWEYDAENRVTKEVFPNPDGTSVGGPESLYEYSIDGNLSRSVDPLGNATDFDYDRLDRMTRETFPDPDGIGDLVRPSITYAYDDVGNVLSETDHVGRTTLYTYDGLDRNTSQTLADPDGVNGPQASPVLSSVYDAAGNIVSTTDANGNTQLFTFDPLGRQISVTDPSADGSTAAGYSTYRYDLVGNLLESTDALGRSTVFTYDASNRQISSTLPDPDELGPLPQPQTFTEYDALGNVTKITDHLGRVWETEYDPLYRKVREVLPDPDGGGPLAAPETTRTYDAAGNVLTSTDPNGNITTWVHDALNRVTLERQPNPTDGAATGGPETTWTYDVVGNVLAVEDPLNRTTQFVYDNLYRQIEESGPDPDGAGPELGSLTTMVYNQDGNVEQIVVRLTETETQTTGQLFDALNRMRSSTDDRGAVTTYEYDANGNRTKLIDPEDNETSFTYDGLNRLTSETNELGDSRYYEYDLIGNRTANVDRRGFRTEYAFDRLDRLATESWLSAGQTIHTIAFDYNDAGLLSSTMDTQHQYTYTYDALDRVLTTTVDVAALPIGTNLTYDYDAAGNVLMRTQSHGTDSVQVSYAYDGLHRLVQTSQSGAAISEKLVTLSYNTDSTFASITRFSDLTQTNVVIQSDYTYDLAGRLTNLAHQQNSTSLAGYGYDLNSAGWITATDSVIDGITDFDYDNTGQLEAADHSTQADESYSYDLAGNRIGAEIVVGAGNRIERDSQYSYEYDEEGNRTKRTRLLAGGATGEYITYQWDHRNRLTAVQHYGATGTPGKQIEYDYDVNGLRVGRRVTESATTETEGFLYDVDRQLAVFANGAMERQYFDGPALDQIFADEDALGQVLWPAADHLGTVRDLIKTDPTTHVATVANHRTIDSFGNVISETDASVEYAFAFTGRYWDEDAELYYHRARWFDAVTGTFLGEDPLGFDAGDANLTRYSFNSPVFLQDNTGLYATNWFSNTYSYFDGLADEIDELEEYSWSYDREERERDSEDELSFDDAFAGIEFSSTSIRLSAMREWDSATTDFSRERVVQKYRDLEMARKEREAKEDLEDELEPDSYTPLHNYRYPSHNLEEYISRTAQKLRLGTDALMLLMKPEFSYDQLAATDSRPDYYVSIFEEERLSAAGGLGVIKDWLEFGDAPVNPEPQPYTFLDVLDCHGNCLGVPYESSLTTASGVFDWIPTLPTTEELADFAISTAGEFFRGIDHYFDHAPSLIIESTINDLGDRLAEDHPEEYGRIVESLRENLPSERGSFREEPEQSLDERMDLFWDSETGNNLSSIARTGRNISDGISNIFEADPSSRTPISDLQSANGVLSAIDSTLGYVENVSMWLRGVPEQVPDTLAAAPGAALDLARSVSSGISYAASDPYAATRDVANTIVDTVGSATTRAIQSAENLSGRFKELSSTTQGRSNLATQIFIGGVGLALEQVAGGGALRASNFAIDVGKSLLGSRQTRALVNTGNEILRAGGSKVSELAFKGRTTLGQFEIRRPGGLNSAFGPLDFEVRRLSPVDNDGNLPIDQFLDNSPRLRTPNTDAPRGGDPLTTGQPGEVVRRFDSKRNIKQAKKRGIALDASKGTGVPTATTNIDPVNPDRIKDALGAEFADAFIDIDISGKSVIRRRTKTGKHEIVITEDIRPEDIVNSGRVKKR